MAVNEKNYLSIHCHAGESASQRPFGLKSDDTEMRARAFGVCRFSTLARLQCAFSAFPPLVAHPTIVGFQDFTENQAFWPAGGETTDFFFWPGGGF